MQRRSGSGRGGWSLLRQDSAATPPGSRSRRKAGRARHWPRSWEVETKVGDTRLGSRTPGTSPKKDKSLYAPHSLPPRRGVPALLPNHCWALFTRESTLSSSLWTNWVPRVVTPASTGERQISAARSTMRHSLLSPPPPPPRPTHRDCRSSKAVRGVSAALLKLQSASGVCRSKAAHLQDLVQALLA